MSPTPDIPSGTGPVPRSFPRASWSRRAIAWFLDAVVTAIPVSVVVTLTGIGSRAVVSVNHGKVTQTRTVVSFEQQLIEATLWLAAQVAYAAILDGSARGQTLGKRWTGIATVDVVSGGPIGVRRAALRGFISAGSLCCLVVPGLVDAFWPFVDPSLRALHDLAAGSVVIEVVA